MLKRRSFLAVALASCAAPAVVRAEYLMKSRVLRPAYLDWEVKESVGMAIGNSKACIPANWEDVDTWLNTTDNKVYRRHGGFWMPETFEQAQSRMKR